MATTKPKSEFTTDTAFDTMPNLEVPAAVRDLADKGAAQAKDAYAKMKTAAEDTSTAVEGAYVNTSRGLSSLGVKAIETVRHNTNASFDHAIALLSVRTMSDAIELNTAFLRKQTEALSQQAKEFNELAQKVAVDMAEPVKSHLEKSMKFNAAA